MNSYFKRLIDSKFPLISKQYRYIRDFLVFKRMKPYVTQFGFQLYGDPHLDTSRSESSELKFFMKCLQEVEVVLDIGANVGLFTCLAAQAKKPVLAFEPHPYNLQCLYRNLKVNEFSLVEVFPIALSDCIGAIPLHGGGQGATLISGWGGIRSTYKTLVPVNTMDNLLYHRLKDKRILIKMDVEGNEFHVLQKARRMLAKSHQPLWIVEHGLTENYAGGLNPFFKELFEIFWEYKYQAYTIDQEQRLVLPMDVKRWIGNKTRDFGGINFLFRPQ